MTTRPKNVRYYSIYKNEGEDDAWNFWTFGPAFECAMKLALSRGAPDRLPQPPVMPRDTSNTAGLVQHDSRITSKERPTDDMGVHLRWYYQVRWFRTQRVTEEVEVDGKTYSRNENQKEYLTDWLDVPGYTESCVWIVENTLDFQDGVDEEVAS